MSPKNIPTWKKLEDQASIISQPENHLKHLLKDKERLEGFSLKGRGNFL